ncbi:unnamed protein product [Gordionus sp. m RMFG-2023]
MWHDYNQKKQIYNDQNQYNNNCNMNIEEIVENKVDTTKDNNANDLNVNNLTENMVNDNDNAFMTTLKLNDVTTMMQVDTGSKFNIIPHEIRELALEKLKNPSCNLPHTMET